MYFLGAAATPALETTRPRDEIAAALAGPLASLAIGAALLVVAAAVDATDTPIATAVGSTALIVGTLDVALGLLNLLPAYPLDGGRVVRAIAWARSGDARSALGSAAAVGRSVGLVIAVLGVVGIFVLEPLDGLMIALGGWFLTSTARGVERRAGIDAVLDGLFVRDVMDRDVAAVSPGLSIDTFASQVLGGSAAMALPVMRGTELLGIIGARQLRKVRPDRWASTRVEDVMVERECPADRGAGDDGPVRDRRPGAVEPRRAAGRGGRRAVRDGHAPVHRGRAPGARVRVGDRRMVNTAGAGRMLSVEAARDRVLAAADPLPAERVLVTDSLGRVVARTVVARTSLPPWPNSAMDGYAIVAADTTTATEDAPARLAVVGEVRAGVAPDVSVRPGTAVRIATGARVPDGSDAVVPVEATTPLDAADAAGPRGREAAGPLPAAILVHEAVPPGGSIRPEGSDLRADAVLAEPGAPIGAAMVALLAGAGVDEIDVHRRPRVAVLATGDEVRRPGEPLGAAGIPDANGPSLRALATTAGADVIDLGIARDVLDDVLARLQQALDAGADLIIVSGGVSVGPFDVVKTAMETIGTVDLWRVAVQPGKPFAFGTAPRRTGGRPVLILGLPGNPVSSAVTFELFVRPAIRSLSGRHDLLRPSDRAVLDEAVTKSEGRRAFIRVVAERDADGGVVRDAAGRAHVHLAGGSRGQGSHVISALAIADALAIVPEDVAGLPAGADVALWWLDRP